MNEWIMVSNCDVERGVGVNCGERVIDAGYWSARLDKIKEPVMAVVQLTQLMKKLSGYYN